MPAGAIAETPIVPQSPKPFLIACCILLVLMEILGYFATRDLSVSLDFRSFYAAGVVLRTHPHQLYDVALQKQTQDALVSEGTFVLPFYHPPFETLLYAPFAILPYRPAYFAFIAFNILLMIATFFAARPLFSTTVPFLQPRPGLIFFFFAPLLMAITQGQDSILFLLLASLAWQQMEDGHDAVAGACLALALFRFQLAIPIVLLFAVRRGWRFSAGFIAAAAAVTAACFALVGRAGMAAWLQVLSASSLASSQDAAAQHVMGIHPASMANLRGLLYALVTRLLAPGHAFALVAIASFATFGLCLFAIWRERHLAITFPIAMLCGLLVSYHLNFHDVTLLLLPMLLLAPRVPISLTVACYCIPAIVFLFIGANWYCLIAIPTLFLLAAAMRCAAKSTTGAHQLVSA